MEIRSPSDSTLQEDAQELYCCCCSNDPNVCDAAFQRLGNFLLRIARSRLRDQPDGEQVAKDCSQQALFVIWQKLSAGNGPDHIAGFLSWCAAIVIHKVFDELRKRGRSRTCSLDEQTENDESRLIHLPDLNTPSPESYAVDTSVKAELIRLIETHDQLSPKAKFVLLCTYFFEWCDDELAHYLDRKEVSIRVLRSRSLKILREDATFMHRLSSLVSFDIASADHRDESDDVTGDMNHDMNNNVAS